MLRLLLAAALTLVAAAPAAAAVPDTWTRWSVNPAEERGATVRSLDFVGTQLYGASEDDGIFTAPAVASTWQEIDGGIETGAAQSVREVKASPAGSLYAATTAGLFTSGNGGGSWAPVAQEPGPRKLNMGGVQSIVFNGASDMVVAIAGAAGPGVYFSGDGGANWDKASGLVGQAVYHLAQGPGRIYAAADDGVFVSLDQGRSWTLASDGISPAETTLRVAVSQADPQDLYASTSGTVYRSDDMGLTWDVAEGKDGQTLPTQDKRAFLLAGAYGEKRALVGTRSGVYASIDDGEHWLPMSAATAADGGALMTNRIVESLGIGFTPASLLAGTRGHGVYALPLQGQETGTVTIGPVSGLKPGTVLTSQLSGFAGTAPRFIAYQWLRCDEDACTPSTPIPGATDLSYTIPKTDANERHRYAVVVTVKSLLGPTRSDTSNFTSDEDVDPAPGTLPMPSTLNSEKPKLSPTNNEVGTPRFGQVYTVVPGRWRTEQSDGTISPTFSYRWTRCKGAVCSAIPNAAGASYTTTTADIDHNITAEIKATATGTSGFYSAGTTNKILNKHPVVTVAPTILGDALTGSTLDSTAGLWDGFDMTYERRWLRCEADGLGCNPTSPVNTGKTYPLTAADLGKRIQLEVTAVGYDPNQLRRTTTYSATTAVVTNPPAPPVAAPIAAPAPLPPAPKPVTPPTTKKKPTIKLTKPKGKLRPGKVLSVPKSVRGFKKLKFQWLRNGKAIKRASKRSYKLKRGDRGKRIACRITLTPTAGGKAITVTTAALKIPKR